MKPIVKRGNVYKIAFTAGRKNAKRHLYTTFQAGSREEAKVIFNDICDKLMEEYPEFRYKTFSLLTGNWKPVTIYHQEEKR